MLAKTTIDSYGGIFVDAEPVGDPTSEIAARIDNRIHEDVAQMTRTVERVKVKFLTTASAGPIAVSVVAGSRTVWGSGAGQYPTISKTTTGTYVITYSTTYEDALVGTTSDSVSETETVNFTFSDGSVKGSTFGTVQTSESGNVLTAYVFDGANPPVLSDLGGGITIEVVAS